MAIKQKPLTSAEVLEEVEWLMRNGMPIEDIPAAVGKSVSAISKASWRAGNSYISKPFNALYMRMRADKGKK